MIYLKLYLVFARIGLFGFGGGMAMLPIIYQGATSFENIGANEFSNLVAISQITPGPIAVNAATYVGYNVAGTPGAVTATLGVATPSFILVILACYFIRKFKESKVIDGAFVGIRPVSCGLIAAAAVFIGQELVVGQFVIPLGICLGTFALVTKWKVNPILLIIISGIIGGFLCG